MASQNTPTFPAIPPSLKTLNTFMRIASDLEKLEPIIGYWVRFYCVQTGLKIDSKSKEAVTFLTSVMDWLEKACLHPCKCRFNWFILCFFFGFIGEKSRSDNEAITNEMVGQAHVENYALQLFTKADIDDREGRATK